MYVKVRQNNEYTGSHVSLISIDGQIDLWKNAPKNEIKKKKFLK